MHSSGMEASIMRHCELLVKVFKLYNTMHVFGRRS